MKRQTIIIVLLALVCSIFAEERRLLTMEDAILNRDLNPKNYRVRWSDDYPNQYLHQEDSVWYAIDVKTGKGILRLIKIKPEGNGEMLASDWANGIKH